MRHTSKFYARGYIFEIVCRCHAYISLTSGVITPLVFVIIVVRVAALVARVVAVTLLAVQLLVGNGSGKGRRGRLYAPILIHKGNAKPTIPPTAAPCGQKRGSNG